MIHGCWLLHVACWLLHVACRLLAVACRLLHVACRLLHVAWRLLQVRFALLLEHGCEKTHNDYFRSALATTGRAATDFGWASIQVR